MPKTAAKKFKGSRIGHYLTKKIFVGLWYDPFFKEKFERGEITTANFEDAYQRVAKGKKHSDIRDFELRMIAENVVGESVVDVGFSVGDLLMILARAGKNISGLDIAKEYVDDLSGRMAELGFEADLRQGGMEQIPFEDDAFDTVVTTHTLEHVRDLKASVAELKRIARKRIIVIVPKETYSTRSDNYHTQFFSDKQMLVDAMGMKTFRVEEVDVPQEGREDIIFIGDME